MDGSASKPGHTTRGVGLVKAVVNLYGNRIEDVNSPSLKKDFSTAMLVRPDKNMGNEKAVEAFKKLQNAYEILMDSLKRKAYDDELRREEILSVFRRFHDASCKNGRHGFFPSGFARSDADGKDPFGDSR
ncbi:hypothetical protein GLYMA_17G182451v4 [Glycine max]|nr:hypothetical protein GLYMA_17G182451v4 [Glycine max]KAH1119019.1 hypothetical protein GYH30_047703 [Glycine max]|eukprot:XP_014624877.1 uncharacterized protein LOC102662575 [Glycine max]